MITLIILLVLFTGIYLWLAVIYKPVDHSQFDLPEVTLMKQAQVIALTAPNGTPTRFRYVNGVPLNEAHFDLEVNFLEMWKTLPSGKTRHFSWVTDIPLNADNLLTIMRGGRARWKIENETFNTLKNQGYHFEHNFGHGHQHLSTVLAYLMLLAFLIDQIQQHCCCVFQLAQKRHHSKRNFWEQLRGLFFNYLIPHWEGFLGALAFGFKDTLIPYDTS